MGLLFIGPLAPVGVFGVLEARTNGAVALVYVLATIAMAFTAWSYAEMSRVVPHAGSVFAYASEGLGRPAGFLAGWLAMLDYLLIPSVAYLFSGIALHALVPAVPAWIFTVVAFAATTALNLVGVRVAARVGTIVLMVEIAVFFVFVVVALAALASTGPTRPALSPLVGAGDLRAVGGGRRHLGRRAVVSRLRCDRRIRGRKRRRSARGGARDPVLPGRGRRPVRDADLSRQPAEPVWRRRISPPHPERQGTAFYDITRAALAPWLATVIAVTKAIGPAFAAMTGQAAAARLLFGMARDGRLPRALASVDAGTGFRGPR